MPEHNACNACLIKYSSIISKDSQSRPFSRHLFPSFSSHFIRVCTCRLRKRICVGSCIVEQSKSLAHARFVMLRADMSTRTSTRTRTLTRRATAVHRVEVVRGRMVEGRGRDGGGAELGAPAVRAALMHLWKLGQVGLLEHLGKLGLRMVKKVPASLAILPPLTVSAS